MGTKNLHGNIQNSNDFRIDYIIDTSNKNLENAKNFPITKFHNDYKKLDPSKIDLVVISTPTITHLKLQNIFLNHTNVLIQYLLRLKDIVI